MKTGQEFIKHEFDEAIAVQQTIVDAGKQLARVHPFPEARTALKEMGKVDEQHLKQLKALGRPLGATGEMEDVAQGLADLMTETLSKAEQAESEAYEAHAVLLNAKRKQQDSAGSVLKIARAMKDTEMRDAAAKMQKEAKASSDQLATLLSDFAVRIATDGNEAAAGASGRGSSGGSRGASRSGGSSRGRSGSGSSR